MLEQFNNAVITFLTDLLQDAANDQSYTDEEYEVIKKFINNEINKLRGTGDCNEQESKEG